MFAMQKLSIFLLLFVTIASNCSAADQAPGDCNQLSGSALGDCLSREYRGAAALLDQKLQQLIEVAEVVDLGFTNPAIAQSTRQSVLKAIRDAHRAWNTQMEVECGPLLEASFGIGNGGGNAGTACRIDMTYQRVNYLGSAQSYAWLR